MLYKLEAPGLRFDLQTFYSQAAICTVQSTLLDDFIPEVGPSTDHLTPVEPNPSCQGSAATPPWPCAGVATQIWLRFVVFWLFVTRGPSGPLGAVCGASGAAREGSDGCRRTSVHQVDYDRTRVNEACRSPTVCKVL